MKNIEELSWTAWSPFQIPDLAAGRADARLEYFEVVGQRVSEG